MIDPEVMKIKIRCVPQNIPQFRLFFMFNLSQISISNQMYAWNNHNLMFFSNFGNFLEMSKLCNNLDHVISCHLYLISYIQCLSSTRSKCIKYVQLGNDLFFYNWVMILHKFFCINEKDTKLHQDWNMFSISSNFHNSKCRYSNL